MEIDTNDGLIGDVNTVMAITNFDGYPGFGLIVIAITVRFERAG